MRVELLDILAKKSKAFTIAQAYKAWGSGEATKMLLSRMEKNGWVERIEKGKYMILPLGTAKGKHTLHEFVIGSMLVQPAIIAYWSALHHHGLTEQIPRTVFIQTTGRRKCPTKEIFGLQYRFIRIEKYKLFGTEKIWLDETGVNITGPEKTVIDCLDRPDLCGGTIEAAKGIRSGTFDMKKLADYASRIGNTGAGRRLGYLLDKFGKAALPTTLPKPPNYLRLDPTMPPSNKLNSKWRLMINLDDKELGELE